MAESIFKTLVEKATFKYVPVIDLRDNSVFGYKILKDFQEAGFDDKEDVYETAYYDGVFEVFLLRLQDKVYQDAVESGYGDKKLFHTIRTNYIKDVSYFYMATEKLLTKFGIKKENTIFELKGTTEWKYLDMFLTYMEPEEDSEENILMMFKETPETPLNKNMIQYMDPAFLEISSLEKVKIIKSYPDMESKIIYKIPAGFEKKYTNEELLEMGIDYVYQL